MHPHMQLCSQYVVDLQVKATGKVVLGCVVVACNLWILLATDINNRPAVQLPGNHCVYNIAAVQWECIPLQVCLCNDFHVNRHLHEPAMPHPIVRCGHS